jgi:glycosyltransferase involved in cell wall biosynthesis
MPTPGTERTRILLVSQTLDRGGLEEAVLAIAGGLDKERFEVCVAYFVGGAVAARLAQLPGVQAVHLDIRGRLRRLLALARLVRESRTDILHNHFCWYGLPAAFLARVRRVETVHNLYTWFTPPQRFAYALTCLLAHRLVAVSAAVREYSVRGFPLVRWKRWETIQNGIETARFRRSGSAELRAEFGLAPGQVVAGFSGRLEEEKGLEHLLDAAAILLATCPAVRFLVAGTGSRETALRRAATERGLTNVTFLGYCPDMARLYPVFDLLAVPSLYEGLPLAVLEAMAAGCPVVAFRVGGIPEAVEDGVQGYLVAPGDTRALAGHVAHLADDPDLRGRMGKAAEARVAEEFSVAGMITRLQALYTGLLREVGR